MCFTFIIGTYEIFYNNVCTKIFLLGGNYESRSNSPIVLVQETVHFGGMILDYRLIAYRSRSERFRIRITSGEERVESTVGNDIEAALRAYRAVLHGRVTPCGLEDVMYDLKSV